MTEDGAVPPGAEQTTVPFRSRGAYAGYRAFGSGDGAALVDPRVVRELRSAAELATQERRVTGGLLFGHHWVDEQGGYLVINGFIEAGPGENRRDRLSRGGVDDFTLSPADLRLLREDGARMYSASLELGWWRSLGALGEFGSRDYMTQAELVGPDGVGLLVYGSGAHWGTAYLGPDGHAPDTAGTLIAERAAAGPPPAPGPALSPEAAFEPEPLPVPDADPAGPAPGDVPPGAPPSGQPGGRMPSGIRVPPMVRRWAGRPAAAGAAAQGRGTPADVQFVVIALSVVIVVAAIIIGVLVHSALVGLIIAVVGLLAVFSTTWMSRR
ncbi:MAG TPA: hypothetical protein VIZ43_16510 [Trebonia sp.]